MPLKSSRMETNDYLDCTKKTYTFVYKTYWRDIQIIYDGELEGVHQLMWHVNCFLFLDQNWKGREISLLITILGFKNTLFLFFPFQCLHRYETTAIFGYDNVTSGDRGGSHKSVKLFCFTCYLLGSLKNFLV